MDYLTIALSLLNAVVAAAPTIEQGIEKGEKLIQALFTSEVIDIAQQNALNSHINSMEEMVAAGIIPDYLKVEADPS